MAINFVQASKGVKVQIPITKSTGAVAGITKFLSEIRDADYKLPYLLVEKVIRDEVTLNYDPVGCESGAYLRACAFLLADLYLYTEPDSQAVPAAANHYNGREVFDQMLLLYGKDAVKGFCICNAFKYRSRAGKKEGNTAEADIAKALWYENEAKSL